MSTRPNRTRTLFLIGFTVGLFAPPTAAAQSYRVIDLDPNWQVRINNDLVAVGYYRPVTPFIADTRGVRFFPGEQISTLRLTNTGYISGIREIRQRGLVEFVAFRVKVDGTDYREVVVGGTSPVMAVDAVSDSGVLIIGNDGSPMRQFAPYDEFNEFQVWDGVRLVPLTSIYGLTSTAGVHITALADDGMIGGRISNEPFLLRPGGPVVRPWSGRGSVSGIGSGGHVTGLADGQIVLRKPDGSVQVFPDLAGAGRPNRFGDFVGASGGPQSRALAVVDGHVIDLSAFFSSPGERLTFASIITDGGVILGQVDDSATGAPTRQVLLVPSVTAPRGLQFAVVAGVVSLSWQSSPGATEYVVEAGTAPGLTNVFNGSVGQSTSITGAVPPGRYYARVRARNIGGTSAPSEEVVIDVP